ncbi:MAG: YHYH protein [Myxococcales bacterium]|nr:YHYH protein [Myxococcales bacterium]
MRITTLSPILTLCLPLVVGCAGDDAGSTSDTDAASSSGASTTGSSGSTGGGGSESSSGGGSSGGESDGATTGGDAWQPAACFDHWELMAELYPEAGALGPCVDVPGGEAVVRSLLVLDGVTIDNNGQTMSPCVEARCDGDYAYIGTNSLPHYDFVQTTPNALVENDVIVRIPLAPAAIPGNADADPVSVHNGCSDAYDQYLQNSAQATTREPGLLCMFNANDKAYFQETLESGDTVTYGKIACLGRTGLVTNGSPVFGPNEATIPDPYGSPLFYMPDVAGEPYLGDDLMGGAALDLCGGHTAASMHYHGVNEACFEQDADGTPAKSYVTASQAWDMAAMLDGECVAESGIVGWSLDGYPIKGPCVCLSRDGQGNCTALKRARSSWVYAGLGAWGNDPQEDAALGIEGSACTEDVECCGGDVNGCDFRCSFVSVEGGGEGSEIAKVCTLLDYSWCSHDFVDRSTNPGGAGFVYLDRCNGVEGADGYAYHTTASFPYINACYRGEPVDVEVMGGGGGMDPPKCMPGQMMCCGDGFCGGPETPQNCPEDC